MLLRELFLLTYFADFNVVFIQAAAGQSPVGKELGLLEYLQQFLGYRYRLGPGYYFKDLQY